MKLSQFFKHCLIVLVVSFGLCEFVFSQKLTARTHIVEIKKMKFIPEKLTISKGDTVIWINRDFFPHDVTEQKNKKWSSSILEKGKSWNKVILKSSNYYCSLHIVMKGKIIVK